MPKGSSGIKTRKARPSRTGKRREAAQVPARAVAMTFLSALPLQKKKKDAEGEATAEHEDSAPMNEVRSGSQLDDIVELREEEEDE